MKLCSSCKKLPNRCRCGQTTIEYLLIIMVIVTVISVFGRKINWVNLGRSMQRMVNTVNTVTIDECAHLAAEANK